MSSVVDVDKLTDAELRTKLLEFGFPLMPITGTTRKVMAKKLKMLLENKNKISNKSGRRSMGRYSSEEDSDSEVKVKKENRRATMAAPIMQPPTLNIRMRKSTRLNDNTNFEDTSSSPKKTEITTTMTRTQRILKSSQDEFDTGSDSESEIVSNNYNKSLENSPTKSTYNSENYASPKSVDSSFSSTRNASFNATASPNRFSSYTSPSLASDYASDKLNQIRSRLSLASPTYDKPTYTSSPEKEETPFLSNFTKRLSALSSQKKDFDYKNDIIKEYDTNGSSTYSRNQLSSFRSTRGRDATYDYKLNQNNILKNNFVSFAVLAGAALFFIFLAIMYLGMKSDTSVVPSGSDIPRCIMDDPKSKKGVNCLLEEDVETAIYLMNVLRGELQKRAVAHKCFDQTIKPHMTESEIVNYCLTNFAIKDDKQIRHDLENLEVLTFKNPEWGIRVIQTEDNNGVVGEDDAASSMEQVVFNHHTKLTSLIIFHPDLPWRCRFYKTFYAALNGFLVMALIFLVLYFFNMAFKYWKYHEQKEKNEVGFMVEKIIDILQMNVNEEGGENFVVINHVRDMILPVADRKKKEKLWEKAVKFINDNESRVRTEVQVVQGEPFEVWRWIGRASLSMRGSPKNKSWQGQAFETQVGSVNSLPCSPTPCLKIRGMVEDGDRNTHTIREAVLSKCAHQCRILHCAVDAKSNCVYLKCVGTNDAAIAYRNLHGWWYSGHLVTVKYLRLERYMQRFPDSPVSGPPFLKAITPAADWSS